MACIMGLADCDIHFCRSERPRKVFLFFLRWVVWGLRGFLGWTLENGGVLRRLVAGRAVAVGRFFLVEWMGKVVKRFLRLRDVP